MVQLYVAVDVRKEPPQAMTAPMTLVETESEIQKMIANPDKGYLIFPDENGVYHGTYMGNEVSLVPQAFVPESEEAVEQ